jgi:hypothetical protein
VLAPVLVDVDVAVWVDVDVAVLVDVDVAVLVDVDVAVLVDVPVHPGCVYSVPPSPDNEIPVEVLVVDCVSVSVPLEVVLSESGCSSTSEQATWR